MPTFSLQQKHADLDQHNAALTIRIAHETGDTPITRILSALGDERQLRGIPALARGVAGAMHPLAITSIGVRHELRSAA